MKRAAGRTVRKKPSRPKSKAHRDGLASYGWPLGLAGLFALSQARGFAWLGGVVYEAGLWLCALAVGTALTYAFLRRPRHALLSLAAAIALASPSIRFMRREKLMPVQGPTFDVVQLHLGRQLPARALLAPWLALGKHDLVSLTFDRSFDAGTAPELVEKYQRLRTPGDGQRVLYVRTGHALAEQDGLRVGRCLLHVRQVALPSLFAYGDRAERHRALTTLTNLKPTDRAVWLGHLGSSPDAADAAALLRAQGLRDARVGHAFAATFPALFGPLGLFLDHVLVRGWIAVRAVDTILAPFPAASRALHVQLELTEPRCRPATSAP